MRYEDQQRILAEYLGFTNVREDTLEHVDIEARSISYWTGTVGDKDGKTKPIPDFNSLDALAVVDQLVRDDGTLWEAYKRNIDLLCGSQLVAFMASVERRREVLIRTLGKWKD